MIHPSRIFMHIHGVSSESQPMLGQRGFLYADQDCYCFLLEHFDWPQTHYGFAFDHHDTMGTGKGLCVFCLNLSVNHGMSPQ